MLWNQREVAPGNSLPPDFIISARQKLKEMRIVTDIKNFIELPTLSWKDRGSDKSLYSFLSQYNYIVITTL